MEGSESTGRGMALEVSYRIGLVVGAFEKHSDERWWVGRAAVL